MSYAQSDHEDDDFLADDPFPRYSNHSLLVLYTLLPALHCRLSKLHNLREVLQHNFSRAGYRHSSSTSDETEASITPPPSYTADDHKLDSLPKQPPIVSWVERTTSPIATPNRQSSSGSTTPNEVGGPAREAAEESESGVRWRYADPGYASLLLARSEVERTIASPSFVRRQYISGVVCVLRGLPEELSPEEEQNLREALPAMARFAAFPEQQLASRSNTTADNVEMQHQHRPSLLQQWVALATMYAMLAMVFLLPYAQHMVHQAWRFDRKHRISEQLFAQGIDAVGAVKRRTASVAARVCAMNDGKVGEQLKDVTLYTLLGVSGGMYQGLGEGLQKLRSRAGKDQ